MNLMLILDMAASGFGERVAVGDAKAGMTYTELYELAGKTASWLRSQPGERLLYTDVASPVLPVALFGASWAGRPYTPLNYRLSDDRLRALVERQAPATLLCGAGTEDRIEGIDGVAVLPVEELLATVAAFDVPEADWANDPEDVGVLLHTSGTSGEPKVAVLRQKHLVSYVFGSVEYMGAGEDEATLVTVPPYHIAGTAAVLTSVYAGRRIIQLPSFEPKEWVQVAREQRVTHAMVVPTMLARILEVLEDGQGLPDLRHLSYGGGRMPLPVIERALELIPHVNFVNAYGLTETSSSIAILGPDDHRAALASDDPSVRARLGSVGRPLPTVVIEIRDPEGNPLPPGERGEIWVSGEQVSGEYAKRRSGEAGGWFQTNDGGYFDEEGFLFVEGRLDDVIVRGGENLSPGEIEDVLLHHDTVLEACVVGIPDDEWGEVVAAVVVLNDNTKATEVELSEWVVAHLRSSRRPSIVEFRTELPYSDTGKVLRRVLREELSRAHQP